jgi:integrase
MYLLLLAETGTRAFSEAVRIQWTDVDHAGGFLHIRSGRVGERTKSGRSRWVPVTPQLATALRDHAAKHRLAAYHGERSPYVFHHTHDRFRARAGERLQSFCAGFKNGSGGRDCRRCGFTTSGTAASRYMDGGRRLARARSGCRRARQHRHDHGVLASRPGAPPRAR